MENIFGQEIDRKLFITCRLCLENDGVYQIVPTVQEQISYCFGIIVEPFDGLPQLLCKNCKSLLNDYTSHKKIFTEKQDSLKKKLEEQKYPGPDIPNSVNKLSQTNNEGNLTGTKQFTSKTIKKRKNRQFSLVVDDITSDSSDSSKLIERHKRKVYSNNRTNNSKTDWKKQFLPHYMCRFCTKSFKLTKSIYKHSRYCRAKIRSRHQEILDVKCTVNLQKIDNKPNITGLTNAVVLRKDKIVHDDGHKLYYVMYTRIDGNKKKIENESNLNQSENSFTGSSEDLFVSNKHRKRVRLHSESSNDTVFIGSNNSPKQIDEIDKSKDDKHISNENAKSTPEFKDSTICIDDSSDSDKDCNSQSVKLNYKTNVKNGIISINANKKQDISIDHKTINEIISACCKKYKTRKEIKSGNKDITHLESQLKHKILSIGRKTISKQQTGSFYCTGLLRYLEHKNLNVVWQGKSLFHAATSKEANLVRMFIKNSKQNTNDEIGWNDIETEEPQELVTPSVDPVAISSTVQNQKGQVIQQLPQVVQQLQIVQEPHIAQQPQIFEQTQLVQIPQIVQPVIQQPHFLQQPLIMQQSEIMGQAILYTNYPDETGTKKLLNTTPVPNPKQLPRKIHSNDMKPTMNNSNMGNNEIPATSLGNEIDESEMVMPVITSTTSLADVQRDIQSKSENDNSLNNAIIKPPRIKVKPASELMKPTSMMNINVCQPSNIWGLKNEQVIKDNTSNIFVPNNLVSQIQNQSASMSNLAPVVTEPPEEEKNSADYVILDTVDFPNTKTDSPFKYFRNLLLLHDIILKEANSELSRNFLCLLKFKVQFKQENKNLTLCLSLYCLENQFCMCVKDGNFVNIHMGKMSANWQWEIMKIFKGDITNKILEKAQEAGQNVFAKTKTFLALLKSINQK